MYIKRRSTSLVDNNLQLYTCTDPFGPGERVDPFTKNSLWIGRLETLLVNGLIRVRRATRWPAGLIGWQITWADTFGANLVV